MWEKGYMVDLGSILSRVFFHITSRPEINLFALYYNSQWNHVGYPHHGL